MLAESKCFSSPSSKAEFTVWGTSVGESGTYLGKVSKDEKGKRTTTEPGLVAV